MHKSYQTLNRNILSGLTNTGYLVGRLIWLNCADCCSQEEALGSRDKNACSTLLPFSMKQVVVTSTGASLPAGPILSPGTGTFTH